MLAAVMSGPRSAAMESARPSCVQPQGGNIFRNVLR